MTDRTTRDRIARIGLVECITETDNVFPESWEWESVRRSAERIADALIAAGLIVSPGMTAETDALVEQMANALSNCSEMLNGLDQMLVMMRGGEAVFNKSPLTYEVDAAMRAWRGWKFDAPLGEG